MTLFLRVLEAGDKAAALRDSIATGTSTFEVDPASFAQVPGSPFAYWVSDRIRRLFKELPPFEGEGRTVRQGLATADDFRFVRAWWEVPEERLLDGEQWSVGSGQRTVDSGQWAVDSGRGTVDSGQDKHQEKGTEKRIREFQEWCRKRTFEGKRWVPFAKGGAYSPYYADIHLVVNWEKDGVEDKAYIVQQYPYLNGNAAYVAKNTDFYFRPGLTWPLRGRQLSSYAVPSGCIFSVAGKMAFSPEDQLTAFLALFNSLGFDRLVALRAGSVGGIQYEVGLIQGTPVPELTPSCTQTLSSNASHSWLSARLVDSTNESSHAFFSPLTLSSNDAGFSLPTSDAEHGLLQTEINDICFKLFGIEGEDRKQIEEWAKRGSGQQAVDSGQGEVVSEQQEGEGEEEGEEGLQNR